MKERTTLKSKSTLGGCNSEKKTKKRKNGSRFPPGFSVKCSRD